MLRLVIAVSGLRIRFGGSLGGVVLPCFRISFGCTNNPPLARAGHAGARWVVGVRACWRGSRGGVVLPCFGIGFGCTKNPPLARAEHARASWIVVVLTSWPMAID